MNKIRVVEKTDEGSTIFVPKSSAAIIVNNEGGADTLLPTFEPGPDTPKDFVPEQSIAIGIFLALLVTDEFHALYHLLRPAGRMMYEERDKFNAEAAAAAKVTSHVH